MLLVDVEEEELHKGLSVAEALQDRIHEAGVA
jgi:hypothetical protein